MKKTLSMAAALLISCSAVCMNVSAADTDSALVYVTIADQNKKFVLVEEPITVTDIDSDGKLTINDTLYIAHEKKFEGGAAAGYKTSVTTWGLGLDRLWGVENGGSYGYYVNDGFSMGLTDEIKNDDQLQAFIYSDAKTYSDCYSFFDSKIGKDIPKGSDVNLTLSYYTFGADSSLISNKLANATITINGKETEYKTDADGKVTIKLTEDMNTVSAVSDSVNIVPPVFVGVATDGAATTTTAAATTTTTVTTTTTTTSTTATTTTTKTASTAAKNGNSPQTGVKGAGLAVAGLITAAATALAVRRRDEE